MEFLNWKNILLEWANRLEFFGRPYYSLNLAEIESFFNEFKTRVTSADIASKSLDTFIKRYYPAFHPDYNKEGKFSPDDYVYGYSLLMHFSCVTHPEEKMQSICNTMQEETQVIIKTFLQNLLECNSFSREAIKTVIESSAPAKISDYVLVLSPIKMNDVDICPPTPKTKILNEWNSENRQLKALVETERYERGFLEMQLKKKDDKIDVLTQERRKFQADIQELKSQLSDKDLENVPPNDNAQMETLKRRLRKDISDRDSEIKELQNHVHDLTAAKQHFIEKFAYVEAQYNKSIANTHELTIKLEDVTEECEKQLQHIKGLEITIKEYQKYFNETNSKGNSLDTSSDNLDDSYAVAMANLSNRSMSSPETLGKVVDIQLREQILMYDNLLNQYNQVQQEKSKMNEQINEHIQKTNDLESKCRQVEDENANNVKRYEDKLEELAALSNESEKNLRELQLLRDEFDSLMLKVNESHQKIDDLTDAKSLLEHQVNVNANKVTELLDENQAIAADNANHLLHIKSLTVSGNKLQSELEDNSALIDRLQASIVQLQEQISKSHEREAILQSEVDRLTKLLEDFRSQIGRLKADQQTLDQEYAVSMNDKDAALNKMEQDRNERIVELEHQVQLVSELTVQLDTANAKLIDAESLKSDLSAQRIEIAEKESKIEKMIQECSKHKSERDSLSETVARLTNERASLNETVACISKERDSLSEAVAGLSDERDSLSETVACLTTERASLNETVASLTNERDSLSETVAGLSDERTSLNETVACLTNERASLNETVACLTNERDSLSETVAGLSDERTLLNETVACLTNERASLNETVACLTDERTSLNETVACLSQERDSLKETVAGVSDERTSLNETVACLSQERDSLNETVACLTNERASLNETVACLSKERDSLSETVAGLSDERNSLNETVACLTKERASLNETVACLSKERDSLSETVACLTNERASLNETVACLTDERTSLNETVACLSQERDSLKETVAGVSDERTSLNETLACLSKERDSLSETVAGLSDERTSLNETVASLSNQIENLELERKIIDSTLLDLNSSIQLVKSENALLREQLSAVEVLRVDLEGQLNQSEEEKEKLFLNLQEKIDEAEATELTTKDLVQQCKAQAAKCDAYETKINELEKSVCELTVCKQNLNELNETLNQKIVDNRESLTKLQSELETVHKNIEHQNSEKSELLHSIDRLTTDVKASEEELMETRVKLSECVDANAQLKIEQQNAKKWAVDIAAERDALIIQVESAERELLLKNQEADDLSKKIEQLKIENETLIADKSSSATDLNENSDSLKQSREEIERYKVDLDDKSKSIELLSAEIEKLKNVEISMAAESNKLSVELKELLHKLESAESSRDTLSLKCISLSDELKIAEDKCTDLESKTTKNDDIKSLELEVDKLKEQIAEMTEVTSREQLNLKTQLQISQEEVHAASKKADENEIQRLAKIEELQQIIEKLDAANKNLSTLNEELTNQQSQNKINIESYQQSVDYKSEIEELIRCRETLNVRVTDLTAETEKLRKDLEKAKHENVSLADENVDLATEIDRLVAINSDNHLRIDELQKVNDTKSTDFSVNDNCAKLEADLQIVQADLQAKMRDCAQAQEIQIKLVNDNKILSAKLTKHRETSALQEAEWQKERLEQEERFNNRIKENRFELEGKLIKMKEKMKDIYTEETQKAKEKHDKQERELTHCKNEYQLLTEKMEKYSAHVSTLSKQVYKLNEQNLEMKKENEFLKTKLRLAESNPRESRLFAPANFGSNFKMEDEEGEIFNNTYLADLKSGISRTSPTGRESIRQSELNHRNSMAPRHLRSTYAAQYGDQNLREEDISMQYFNDSMFSNQLDVRRGTLYQRPGPPTPSKNGGRLSFGGSNVTASDLFPKEVLREQNNNAKTKTTPGKLMSMFSSKHKENPTPKKRLSIFKKKTNL